MDESQQMRLTTPASVHEAIGPLERAFYALKAEFEVKNSFQFSVKEIHVDTKEVSNPKSVAAFTMRRIQTFVHTAHTVTKTGHVTASSYLLLEQLSQLRRHSQTHDCRQALDASIIALDQAIRSIHELLAMHSEAIGHQVDVELGPTAVPDTPAELLEP